jgi:hypothetical protein
VLAAEFVGSRRETGLVTWTSPQTVALPLGYLREIGVVPGPAPSAGDGRLEELLAAYRRFLLGTVGWRSCWPRTAAFCWPSAACSPPRGNSFPLKSIDLVEFDSMDTTHAPNRGAPNRLPSHRAGKGKDVQ